MYASFPGHTVNCFGLIRGIYTDIVVSHLHMKTLACVAYTWHLRDVLIMNVVSVQVFLLTSVSYAIDNLVGIM